ncbi:MAG TPA: hypothetical protein PKY12_00055 [Catalimonadaceae bacterium]|jgi:uncharacterized tellurite resistance protein B-like protein|nr:hypothetical protein [Catalimonadaceae bacterium]
MKNYAEYYKQLGNLLYSISAIDGSIAAKELKELRKIVKEELVPLESHNDDFGTDAAFAVEFQFDVLEGSSVTTEEAWEEVESYLKHNAPLLPEKDKKLMATAANRVAEAFHGINKEEHQLLDRLSKLLS